MLNLQYFNSINTADKLRAQVLTLDGKSLIVHIVFGNIQDGFDLWNFARYNKKQFC